MNAKEARWAIINSVANKFTVSLMSDKFCALHQHRESTAGKTQVHHVGGNANIQVSFMWKVIMLSVYSNLSQSYFFISYFSEKWHAYVKLFYI